MNWKQPKQLSKTTLPFGRSLNGHGRSGKEGLTGFATTLCVSHRRWARAGLARARMAVANECCSSCFQPKEGGAK